MLTLTLLDVEALNGLKPTRETFDPGTTSQNFKLNFKRASFIRYIEDNHVTDNEEVSDMEHFSFLILWLSHFIFCSPSLKVVKMYINLAIQLHEGQNICLSKLILGSMYEALGLGAFDLKRANLRVIY